MKSIVRGGALDVSLRGEPREVAGQLVRQGFTQERADDFALAALKYATQESDQLTRQLMPPKTWEGVVVMRRHFMVALQEVSVLVLKCEGQGAWKLDAALFE